MKSQDIYDDMSVDAILNDVKKMNNEKEKTGKIWSLDEIDALIADVYDSDDEAQISDQDVGEILKTLEDEEFDIGFTLNESEEIADEPEVEKAAPFEELSDSRQEIEPLLDSTQADDFTDSDEEKAQEIFSDEVPGQITIEKTRVFNEVETRTVRKEGIDHNIGKSKIIRTGEIPKGGMEKDPYRERFFNKPQLKLEKTQDHINPVKTIEKHGVVVKKPEFEKTGDDGLSPIPILVDAVDEYEAQQRLEAEVQSGKLDSSELDNQIILDGFDSGDEEVKIVSEAEEEAKLRRIRKDRASKFKLFPNIEYDVANEEQTDSSEAPVMPENIEDGFTKRVDTSSDDEIEEAVQDGTKEELKENEKIVSEKEEVRIAREFFGPKDVKAVHAIFTKELNSAKFRMISSILSLLVLLVCSIITSMFSNFSVFANSPYVYSALNLTVLIAIGGVNYKAFGEAIHKLKKKKFNYSVALSLSIAVGVLQCLVSFAYGELVLSGMHIYAAVALFPVMLINIGEYIKLENDFTNFVLLNNESGKFYAIKSIDEEDVAFEVGRGLMIKDPDIRYRAKVGFPDKFVEMSRSVDPTSDMFKLVIPVALAAGALVCIISSIIYRNIFVGVSALAGVYLMAVPAGAFLSAFSCLREANKQLNRQKCMVSGYEAVDDILNTNAVVVDSVDIFKSEKTNIYGIKLFNSMRIDEAILYTAAVIIQSDGALTEVFDTIIGQNREMLPTVESLAYEEKLGCSGWIYNYRVLVGNRDLLIKHNVEVQSKEEERKYSKGNKQIIYLAVEGKVAAMFVVAYGADEKIAHYFRALEKAGVNILVKTSDANITEEFIEQHFNLPRNFIKIISPVAGVMFREYSEKETEKEPCRILSDGKVKSSLRALLAAFTVNGQRNISNILQYVGVGIGILLMSMFAFFAGLTQAGVLQIILFESLWSLLVIFVPQLVKKI